MHDDREAQLYHLSECTKPETGVFITDASMRLVLVLPRSFCAAGSGEKCGCGCGRVEKAVSLSRFRFLDGDGEGQGRRRCP